MVVVALLSVDLVSVELVVNCTLIFIEESQNDVELVPIETASFPHPFFPHGINLFPESTNDVCVIKKG